MGKVRISGTRRHSSVNGPGVRYVLFFQGCPHRCPGCQNPETLDAAGGTETTTEALTEDILATRYLDGVTFSGGDPLMQPEALAEIARAVRARGLPVWVYTGWTYEQVMDGRAGEAAKEALRHVDVLVDGPFVEKKKTGRSIWRGSDNQRLIDVPKSLELGHACELGDDAC